MKKRTYDVIVIGAGHAGCEAAFASAAMGTKTLLITTNLDTVGFIACSASFGGPGRGQLLREIDSMGGLMPQIVDSAAIHFRHSGKNTTRKAPFAICDRLDYHRYLKSRLEAVKNLHLKQDKIKTIAPAKNRWTVFSAAGQTFIANCLVVAVGTFLKGKTHFGKSSQKAGRDNEPASQELEKCLFGLGVDFGVFRTGTGPTIKIEPFPQGLEEQHYDKKPFFCSAKTDFKNLPQASTFKTHTTKKTIDIVKKQQRRKIKGPRHCLSLADKTIMFPKKNKHPVFLQPESFSGQEWFLNGASMDFNEDIQREVVASITGLEKAEILKFGYSVTYGYLKSGQLRSNLESRKHAGLFFAGQVIGSNGYEEAAALGLVAGKNAALKAKKQASLTLDNKKSYIGILVNDITSKRITEPYRIFLSRMARCLNSNTKDMLIPYSIDFTKIGLSKEAIEKLKHFKPTTIEDALTFDIPKKSIQPLALFIERTKG